MKNTINYKIYVIVVVYNKDFNKCSASKLFSQFDNGNIVPVIVDNSTIKNENEYFCIENNYIYISMQGNKGLSCAYNQALKVINYNSDDIIMLLDDDTRVNKEFFECLIKQISENPDYDIYCPCIRGQDGKFYSPNEYRLFKSKQMKNIDSLIRNNKFNAINSCTSIRAYVFDSFRYDERQFLDQIDHYFFRVQRKLHRRFFKIRYVIDQSFYLDKTNKLDYSHAWNRYRFLIHDFLVMYDDFGFFINLLCFLKIVLWGLRGIYRYKSIKFLIMCINQFFMTKKELKP